MIRVMDDPRDQVFHKKKNLVTIEKQLKLVMSLQSSEIKLAGTILLR